MGQVATLTRINKLQFEEVMDLEIHPSTFEEQIYVDKNWEAIMYILGNGFIGREPTVNLFMPKNIIVTYEDEYMQDGIRYHSELEINELHQILENFPINEAVDKVDLDDMNKKTAYPTSASDLGLIKDQINEIKLMFANAVKEGGAIIGNIG